MLQDPPRFDDAQLESLLSAPQPSRRGFLAASGLAGFAVAAGPVNAQSVIRTPADGLEAGDFTVAVQGGGNMPAYLAAPQKAGKYPVVVVIPEIFGLHEYQKDMCRRLAKQGYLAVSLDPFFRIGDLSKIAAIGEVVAAANKLSDTQMLSDMDSLVAHVGKLPKAHATRLGVTGMCRGGRAVWMYTAHSPKVKAGVAWYGSLAPIPPAMPGTPQSVAGKLHAPVLGLYGGADPGIPVAQVAALQSTLEQGNAAARASRFVLYPDTPHAFHADYRPSYRKEAAEDGWQRMLAWFRQHGV